MKKTLLIRVALIEDSGPLKKYSTQIPNIFIYDARIGNHHQTIIFNDQKDKQSPRFGEKSVVVTHYTYEEGIGLYGGIEYIGYTEGLERKYYVPQNGTTLGYRKYHKSR